MLNDDLIAALNTRADAMRALIAAVQRGESGEVEAALLSAADGALVNTILHAVQSQAASTIGALLRLQMIDKALG